MTKCQKEQGRGKKGDGTEWEWQSIGCTLDCFGFIWFCHQILSPLQCSYRLEIPCNLLMHMHVISVCFSLSIFIGAAWELKPPVFLRASIPFFFFFKADVHLTSKWFYKCSLNNTCTRKSIQFFLLPLPWEQFNTFSSQGYLSVSTPLGFFCTVCHTFFFFFNQNYCVLKSRVGQQKHCCPQLWPKYHVHLQITLPGT